MHDHRLTLPDGRRLAFAQYGASAGDPVLYCHGFPGSRLEAAFADAIARRVGARLIAIDRPGMGRSGHLAGRTVLGWADDARAVADSLELRRFSVIGVSGGAPYALACALVLAHRVVSAGIVSGVAPPAALSAAPMTTTAGLGLRMTGRLPRSASLITPMVGVLARHAFVPLVRAMAAGAPEPDRRILRDPAFGAVLGASLREAFRQGARGAATDLRLLAAPWGFDVHEVHTHVDLWHGEDDRVVPASMGRFLDDTLRECRATFMSGEGHYSLIGTHAERILATVLGHRLA